jgi:ankyrin repeat protein
MKNILLKTIAAVLLVGTGYAGPIHTSASKGDLAGVQAQLDIGVDVNAKGSLGESPLHKAAKMGRKDMVQLRIDKGADLNAKEDEGLTPLDWAIKRGRTATADLLRKHGGKYSTIHTPAMIGDIETVKELLADGANVNAKDEFGKTPLDRAIKYQRTEIADLLRKHGGKTSEELKAEAAK